MVGFALLGAILSWYLSRSLFLALWILVLPFLLPRLGFILERTSKLFHKTRSLRPRVRILAGIGITMAVSFILSFALGNSGVILSQFMAGPLIWMLTTPLPEAAA